jgi:hypothetical protein
MLHSDRSAGPYGEVRDWQVECNIPATRLYAAGQHDGRGAAGEEFLDVVGLNATAGSRLVILEVSGR